jgi:hypothetical protein
MELSAIQMDKAAYEKYNSAKQRVKKIKDFHQHGRTFLVISGLLLVIRFFVLPYVTGLPQDKGFQDWLTLNTILMPLLWSVVLGVHALRVFGAKWTPMRRWEERKIDEFLQKEEEKEQQNY